MKPVIFIDPAKEEMIDAAIYYEAQAAGLGEEFLSEVEHITTRIQEYPKSGKPIKKEIRRMLTKHFPFSILYQETHDEIIIIAVALQKNAQNIGQRDYLFNSSATADF